MERNRQEKASQGQAAGMMRMPGGGPGRGGGAARFAMPVVKPRDFKGTMLRLWKYMGKERKQLTTIFIFIAGGSGIGLLIPYLIGWAVNSMSEGERWVDFGALGIAVLSLLAMYITGAALSVLQEWMMAGVSQRIVLGLRRTMFDKLQKLPLAFFDTHTHGELMSRLSNDIDNISSTISQSATHLMSSGIAIIGSLVMMLVLSPLLTLASVITIPLVFLLTRTIAKRTRVLFKEQQMVLGKLNGCVEETISGMEIVKTFNREDKVIEQFDEINEKLRAVGTKAQTWSGFIMPLMNVINNIGFVSVACVGGMLAVKDLIAIGTIASFLSYSRQFVRPLNEIANIFNTLQTAAAGAERIFEVMDEKEETEDMPDAKVLENPRGHVVFDRVTFGYRSDVSVLKDITFDIREGSNNAFVGPTGAGKTTIVNLLTRFYDVSDGRILIDGRDIREYTRDSLRRCFGIVLQDTYLFSGTIRDNIKYGRPEATDEEMQLAAAMANADSFIRHLPGGYDTVLTESGSNLSQGQRQLLAIARAILANPSILILDEATSSVDTRTELHIQEALWKLMKDRTSFIIAHRLSTIRNADSIMVINNGKLIEQGSHDCLIAEKRNYYNMYFSQFRQGEDV